MPSTRTPLIAGNWKMNTTLAEARILAYNVVHTVGVPKGVDVAVCPPFVSLPIVAEALRGSPVALGAQNLYPAEAGAYTGEVAPNMLQGLCRFVIVGHSERRAYFAEADEFVNAKVRTALEYDLTPIMCVGETLQQREAGETENVLRTQTSGGLADVDDVSAVVIAYEPVWAIGTGVAATPDDAREGIAVIRNTVAEAHGQDTADSVRILYGGSMNPQNVASLLEQPGIDGGLIGGAALNAEQFVALVRAAEEHERE